MSFHGRIPTTTATIIWFFVVGQKPNPYQYLVIVHIIFVIRDRWPAAQA